MQCKTDLEVKIIPTDYGLGWLDHNFDLSRVYSLFICDSVDSNFILILTFWFVFCFFSYVQNRFALVGDVPNSKMHITKPQNVGQAWVT